MSLSEYLHVERCRSFVCLLGCMAVPVILPGVCRAQEGRSEAVNELRSQVRQMADEGASADAIAAQIRNVYTEAALPNMSMEDLATALRSRWGCCRAGYADLTVSWRGFLKPIQSGNYVFSTTPVDSTITKSQSPRDEATVRFRVTIDGEVVLDANENGWNYRGQPVALEGGESVPIVVDFTSYRAFNYADLMKPVAAHLLWQSDQTPLEVVPAEVFLQPDGFSPGLLGEYTSGRPAQRLYDRILPFDAIMHEESFQQVDPNIDLLSLNGGGIAMRNREMMDNVAAELWRRVTADSTLAEIVANSADAIAKIPLITSDTVLIGYLSPTQRKGLIARLLEARWPSGDGSGDVSVATSLTRVQAASLYAALRTSAPVEAMELLGAWLESHPVGRDDYPLPTLGRYSRPDDRFFATMLAAQLPEHYQLLRDEYLVTENGGCNQSAATLIAYGELFQDRLDDWIAQVDQQIAATEGDAKATWLMARAVTAEIRRCPPSRFISAAEDYQAGKAFLEQASEAATSADVRSRVYRERAVRAMANRQVDAAMQLAQQTGVPRFVAEATEQIEAEQTRRRESRISIAENRLEELRRRLEAAETNSGPAQVARYQRLVEAAEQELSLAEQAEEN